MTQKIQYKNIYKRNKKTTKNIKKYKKENKIIFKISKLGRCIGFILVGG